MKKIEYTYGFSIAYWKAETNEGFGVLHVLFRVDERKKPRRVKKACPLPKHMRGFIPHKWLSETWSEIHGTKVVEIHELKRLKSERDIACYVVGNYVSKQPIKRISYSRNWVCRGFSKKWKTFKEAYGKRAVEPWGKWLLYADFLEHREIKLDAVS